MALGFTGCWYVPVTGNGISFGIVFATAIILVLVPCLYMILEDIKFRVGNGQTASGIA